MTGYQNGNGGGGYQPAPGYQPQGGGYAPQGGGYAPPGGGGYGGQPQGGQQRRPGSGTMSMNQRRRGPNDPEWTGKVMLPDGTYRYISMWSKQAKGGGTFWSFSINFDKIAPAPGQGHQQGGGYAPQGGGYQQPPQQQGFQGFQQPQGGPPAQGGYQQAPQQRPAFQQPPGGFQGGFQQPQGAPPAQGGGFNKDEIPF